MWLHQMVGEDEGMINLKDNKNLVKKLQKKLKKSDK